MKKYSIKPRKRKIKTRKRSRKRGGVILGEGSFGTVVHPAYPCDVADIPNIKDNVSKIAMNKNAKRELEDEMNNADIVRYFEVPGDMTGTIDDYFLLPSKMCRMKLKKELFSELRTSKIKREKKKNLEEYLKEIFKDNGKSWATSKYGILNDKLQKYISSYGNIIEKLIIKKRNNFFHMLIMPKADMDLYNRFETFPNNYINNIVILQNIANGIKILQMNGYCHNDLKLSNCVYHNKKGKIIDLSMMFNILSYAPHYETRCFQYSYPSIDCYEHYFITNHNKNDALTCHSLKALLKKTPQTLKNDIYSNNKFYFSMPENCTYHVDNTYNTIEKYIQTILKKLILQKTFGIDDDAEIYNYMNNDNHHNYDLQVNDMLTYFFDILSKKNFDKLDFYKRYDIYSFGLMLYNFLLVSVEPSIKKYLAGMYYPTVRDDQAIPIAGMTRKDYEQHLRNKYKLQKRDFFVIIFELYKLVFYCCYQTYECPDINHIIDYMKIITRFFTMSTTSTTSTIVFDDDVDPLIYIQEIHEQNGTIEKYNNSQINILFYSVNPPDDMEIDERDDI